MKPDLETVSSMTVLADRRVLSAVVVALRLGPHGFSSVPPPDSTNYKVVTGNLHLFLSPNLMPSHLVFVVYVWWWKTRISTRRERWNRQELQPSHAKKMKIFTAIFVSQDLMTLRRNRSPSVLFVTAYRYLRTGWLLNEHDLNRTIAQARWESKSEFIEDAMADIYIYIYFRPKDYLANVWYLYFGCPAGICRHLIGFPRPLHTTLHKENCPYRQFIKWKSHSVVNEFGNVIVWNMTIALR